jgi:hypothetical protein
MIREIGRELETKLAAKGCPFKVVDRESKPTTWRNAIVWEELATTYSGPTSQSRNAKRYFDANTSVKLRVYAQSAKASAQEFEHRRLAHRVADLALVALLRIRAERKIGLKVGTGAFVPIEDLADSDRPGGVCFEVLVTFARGVQDLDWAGADYPEFTFIADSISNTTEVALASVPEDDGNPDTPEIACGA